MIVHVLHETVFDIPNFCDKNTILLNTRQAVLATLTDIPGEKQWFVLLVWVCWENEMSRAALPGE